MVTLFNFSLTARKLLKKVGKSGISGPEAAVTMTQILNSILIVSVSARDGIGTVPPRDWLQTDLDNVGIGALVSSNRSEISG